jgi:3-hydroxyacyl-CoA dehydrogenase / 3-hydroxy-2-methylbutyryl-CoA dehydrogenase
MDLEGASVIVTGGASGLGEASVRRLVARGANITIADINDERAKGIVDELGSGVVFVHTDVTLEADVQELVRVAAERGPIRVVVNCAGYGVAKRVVARDGTPHDLESFVWTVNLCLFGTFNVMRLAAAAMAGTEPDEDGQRGAIVNTASIAAFDGQVGQVAYSASKGGVVGMTLPVARDLAQYGIRVVTIAPGLFDTQLLAALPEEARTKLGEQIPFPPRLGRPEEYAQLAAQIVENPMLNGETIRLDGALRMAPR